MSEDQSTRLNTALSGRYEIVRSLGHGGMANVYLATDVRHSRTVAIKVLRPDVALAIGPTRFAHEIEISARLNHPHILALHDSGEAAGFLYYVMPFVEGESLRARLDREKQFPIAEVVRLATQIATALDHAHAKGLVHRDIKPENILLHEGEALVADFGIALREDTADTARLTGSGYFVGTPEYMSPEQVAGERDLDARSDVYSLGCVVYEMLCGKAPFTAASARAVMAKRFTEPVPRPSKRRPEIPFAIDQAVAKALAQAPEDRYESAGAFAKALSADSEEGLRTPSVAVLPFLTLGSDPENEFFGDGITEDVIAQLAKIRSLKVISRSSVMQFKSRSTSNREIGSQLGVSTVLDGSVRKVGNRVRIVAQLVDTRTDENAWAETYDRDLTDIFAIQSDVALQIAGALKAELTRDERRRIRREPTSNLLAYQLYLQARDWYSRFTAEGTRKAIGYYEQAIELDPTFAQAYASLALLYAEIQTGQAGADIPPKIAYERARELAGKALELDPNLGEAHGVIAFVRLTNDFDWVGAENEFKLALQLSPGSADALDHYGWLCGATDRFDEAIAMVKRAKELDPLVHVSDLATALLRAGRYEEALEEAERILAFEPTMLRGHSALGWSYIKLGRWDEGIAELETAVRLSDGDMMFKGQLGEAYGLGGDREKAMKVLEELREQSKKQHVSPYLLAYVYTGLGDYDSALDCLEEAYHRRAGGSYGIKGSFLFEPLREQPRFKALLRKMNLDS